MRLLGRQPMRETFSPSKTDPKTLLRGDTARRHQLPPGQCSYCDAERRDRSTFHPAHDPSPNCQSGKRPHCSCDVCF